MSGQSGEPFTDPGDSPRLFAHIARRYDAMNRLMSLGRDQRWRRLAAEALDLGPQARVLDVGFGTGDMALALRRCSPSATVIGVDPTRLMMEVSRGKPAMEAVGLAQADGLYLPFSDELFDAAISAFVLRNVPDVGQALREQHRVVRIGGRVACLEMSWPDTPVFGALFRVYFATVMPWITGRLTDQRAAYRYLPKSVESFQTPEELTRAMTQVGLKDARCQRLALGTVTIHVGVRTD